MHRTLEKRNGEGEWRRPGVGHAKKQTSKREIQKKKKQKNICRLRQLDYSSLEKAFLAAGRVKINTYCVVVESATL